MRCSHCGREFEPAEAQQFCAFCGGDLESKPGRDADLGEPELVSNDLEYLDSPGYCPWEDQERLGFLQGLTMTLRESLFAPNRFFSRMPVEGGMANPLLYSLIVSTTANVLYLIMAIVARDPVLTRTELSGLQVMLVGISIPVLILVTIAVWAGLLHLSLSLVGGANRDFEATLRVVCYTSGPDFLKIIPYAGSIIAVLWRCYLIVVGLKEAHRVSTGVAVLAFALPAVVCCGAIFGMAVLVVAMGVLAV
ncbi:MAG: YIP1 family protein [Thermodesulfobacteriota bacterium]